MSILLNKTKSIQSIVQLRKCEYYIVIKRNFHLIYNRSTKFILKKSTSGRPVSTDTNDFNLDVDLEYIEKNVKLRQSNVDLSKLKSLVNEIKNVHKNSKGVDDIVSSRLHESLQRELQKLPNRTHPDVLKIATTTVDGDKPRILSVVNETQNFTAFKPLTFKDLTKPLNLLRMEHLGNFNGHKSYYLLGVLAQLENALIKYTIDKLKGHKFQIISVPDILPAKIIESCGMQTDGERTQVYKLKNLKKCLSGTSEMSLAGLYSNEIVDEVNLPIKLASVSRCFRAETSGLQEEKGIYRVHQFTKVEMFSICSQKQSNEILNEFREIQINLFNDLDLHFKVLDMPPYELGNSAYRKYDIEAWMPGKCAWGEISSCSNCTDYQAKRLNIQVKRKREDGGGNNGCLEYAHTVNGTACAVPRMLIALFEQFQTKNREIKIPKALKPYLVNFDDCEMITTKKNKLMPELKLVKNIN